MNPIRTNKPVFFGNDGEVLKSGQIYIGQPNQWPLGFPKTVTFQDSAGSQFTASQPLRTNKQGQISYNGKAIIALVDGNYSMLVQDRNGVQVNDGYTPFINNTAAGGGGTEGATQVGTLLSDIKQFNVTPGQTVRNVGQSTALDGLGADWLVVSNTGSSGDDANLIDFANGTQGQRIKNFAYRDPMSTDIVNGLFKPEAPRLIWSGSSTSVPVSEFSEDGPGFYVARSSGGISISMYVLSTSMAIVKGGGALSFGTTLYSLQITAGTPVMRMSRFTDGGSTEVLQTITEIYKV